MDEFKPEDELKPDTSDRRPQRSRKSAPKVPVSRQHMMMGIGILVLLLLVLGIGSALNSPDENASKGNPQPSSSTGSSGAGSDKSIDLSGSSSISGQSGAPAASTNATDNAAQQLSAPPVSSTPTQAEPVQTPANQQRVELPGDLNNALSGQQEQTDAAAQDVQQSGSLPTAPATVAPGGNVSAPKAVTTPSRQAPHAAVHKPQTRPVTRPAERESKAKGNASVSHAASQPAKTAASQPAKTAASMPGGSYTLQLSSASRSDTLNAWAKQQNLGSYHVYKTTRNGQPWYVLVSGSYATSAEAKRAVASLPADVRAKSPWVKPVSQVKKEAAN